MISLLLKKRRADVAQSVERILGKDEVAGSNPAISSRNPEALTFKGFRVFRIYFSVFSFAAAHSPRQRLRPAFMARRQQAGGQRILVRSLITSPASMRPAAAGTKATEPGTARRGAPSSGAGSSRGVRGGSME